MINHLLSVLNLKKEKGNVKKKLLIFIIISV